MPTCNAASLDFLNTAKVKEVNTVVLPASAHDVFELFRKADAWPKWFKGIDRVVWTSPEPFGIGTTRTVWLGPLRVDEYFFDWIDDQRFAFYFTGTNLPFVRTLVEFYELEPLTEQSCRFTYTVAYDPAFPLSATGFVGRMALGRTFRRATQSLASYLKKNR
jgi:hypothetical protein